MDLQNKKLKDFNDTIILFLKKVLCSTLSLPFVLFLNTIIFLAAWYTYHFFWTAAREGTRKDIISLHTNYRRCFAQELHTITTKADQHSVVEITHVPRIREPHMFLNAETSTTGVHSLPTGGVPVAHLDIVGGRLRLSARPDEGAAVGGSMLKCWRGSGPAAVFGRFSRTCCKQISSVLWSGVININKFLAFSARGHGK